VSDFYEKSKFYEINYRLVFVKNQGPETPGDS